MTVEISPSCRCIRGPCFLAKSLMVLWGRGLETSWCKFPITGSFRGPGIGFELLDFDDFFKLLNIMKRTRRIVKRTWKEGRGRSSMATKKYDDETEAPNLVQF